MTDKKNTGLFQLDNGYWGRYKVKIDGMLKESCRTSDKLGNPFKKPLPVKHVNKLL